MHVKTLFILALLSLSMFSLKAQRGYCFSFGAGASYYYGDLTDGFSNVFVRPGGNISYGYYFTPSLSLRLGLGISQIGAADSLSGRPGLKNRNLHFRNNIIELSALMYYELIPDKKFGIYWRNKPHFSPYGFIGVALFSHNPKALYQGDWVRLQPLGTEGQFIPNEGYGQPYSLLQVAFPIGGGVSYRFTSNMAVAADIGYRLTLTDYLDDVSTTYPDMEQLGLVRGEVAVALSDPSPNGLTGIRGNPGAKDGYFFGFVSLTFYLDRDGNR
jgi:hypothetical protein